MESDINITYDSIFETLVQEKSRDELQKLSDEFYSNLVAYLSEKKSIAESESDPDLAMKNQKQLQNIYRITRELYERREKKIVGMALACSKAKSIIVDTSPLLPEEKIVFDTMLKQLDHYRNNILTNVIAAKAPSLLPSYVQNSVEPQKQAPTDKQEQTEEQKTRLVRFLQPVPKFVGSELEVYGPFQQEDVASLPPDIADLLINKGRAEEISQL